MTIALLVLALVFNLLAQTFLKQAVTGIRFDTFDFSFVGKLISTPQIWLGAFFYGVSFLFYVMALSRGELSRISPVSQALTTLGVVLISIVLFHEPLTLMKTLGLLLLVAGTIILFQ